MGAEWMSIATSYSLTVKRCKCNSRKGRLSGSFAERKRMHETDVTLKKSSSSCRCSKSSKNERSRLMWSQGSTHKCGKMCLDQLHVKARIRGLVPHSSSACARRFIFQ